MLLHRYNVSSFSYSKNECYKSKLNFLLPMFNPAGRGSFFIACEQALVVGRVKEGELNYVSGI